MAKNPTKQFQAAWAKAWLEENDENARMLLVESCMGLARKAAMALLRTDLDWDDLEAEGVTALYEATVIYRPDGGDFSACAFVTVRYRADRQSLFQHFDFLDCIRSIWICATDVTEIQLCRYS